MRVCVGVCACVRVCVCVYVCMWLWSTILNLIFTVNISDGQPANQHLHVGGTQGRGVRTGWRC